MKQIGLDGQEHSVPDQHLVTILNGNKRMLKLYGKKDGKICGKCKHLTSYTINNKWYHRCVKVLAEGNPTEMFFMHQQACGMYSKREGVKD